MAYAAAPQQNTLSHKPEEHENIAENELFQLAYQVTRARDEVPRASANSSFTTSLDYAVMREMLTLKSITAERSLTSRMAHAVPIWARISQITLEPSSMRYVITYIPDRGDGTVEKVRSDRLDSAYGDLAQSMWSVLRPDDHVCIYKVNEREGNYRVCPYVVKLNR